MLLELFLIPYWRQDSPYRVQVGRQHMQRCCCAAQLRAARAQLLKHMCAKHITHSQQPWLPIRCLACYTLLYYIMICTVGYLIKKCVFGGLLILKETGQKNFFHRHHVKSAFLVQFFSSVCVSTTSSAASIVTIIYNVALSNWFLKINEEKCLIWGCWPRCSYNFK